ncbi:hypothetical protein IHE56_04350 [Streptomyces sp. ID01-12c]|uniref:hypothetical protein n=1 Tax=Streptomyces caniscabiei TaxID=2746961 RepID=UPI001781D839|nr:hypothetical protein [Streptomyces caniscabiei]MBD9701334.1 hypothetical protein [Streptomyces caniscabiei]MDX3726486.1 hypothetical protein [Streptomyces caniscabiei]
MNDFPHGMGDDRTPADERLDQLLASVDTELLTSIDTARAQTWIAYNKHTGRPTELAHIELCDLSTSDLRALSLSDLSDLREQRNLFLQMLAGEEVNHAVLRAEEALHKFAVALETVPAVSPLSPVPPPRIKTMFVLAGIVKQKLRTRTLNREEADGYFDTVDTALIEMVGVELTPELTHTLLSLNSEARASVLYLFDHADEYGECHVPSGS